MLGLEPEIEEEFNRVLAQIEDPDRFLGPYALKISDVLRAHFLVVNHFYLEGEGLGGIGPRDLSLLYSAVSRQDVSFGGQAKWTDRFDVCATLFYGLIKNHAFHDANKRTAFLSALFQLYRGGWCPAVDKREFEDFTVEIAESTLSKHQRFRKMIKEEEHDTEIRYISWYLRKNTRQIDTRHYTVTYRELQVILRRYGCALMNPHGNFIDVVRIEKHRPLFGLLRERENVVRLGQIGFPRWTAQVARGALKTVREVAGLTAEKGVDSASFFNGLDPMQTLITTYHEPLMRLSQR